MDANALVLSQRLSDTTKTDGGEEIDPESCVLRMIH
ncbi:Os12g0273960 [Oryza sativa Japonica Group]|uniref:Os12g0273960 protein n=1 Tax=Oryza sativa subsp. japonica TaxID=39947 RepID=C7J9L0_ORYSJ|nr:Os12g0273960 [Oryza sativa Japonica Group]|eukprot:NP_001176898.1 Os12g0273960 [Oryza sativa Japonica Group]